MSAISDKVHEILLKIYPPIPFKRVFEEHYVKYEGQRLFFDFYVKESGLLVEVQGQQHTEFNKFFHSDKRDFLNQKKRDNLKRKYVQENANFLLIRIYYNENITESLVLDKINKAFDDEYGFAE